MIIDGLRGVPVPGYKHPRGLHASFSIFRSWGIPINRSTLASDWTTNYISVKREPRLIGDWSHKVFKALSLFYHFRFLLCFRFFQNLLISTWQLTGCLTDRNDWRIQLNKGPMTPFFTCLTPLTYLIDSFYNFSIKNNPLFHSWESPWANKRFPWSSIRISILKQRRTTHRMSPSDRSKQPDQKRNLQLHTDRMLKERNPLERQYPYGLTPKSLKTGESHREMGRRPVDYRCRQVEAKAFLLYPKALLRATRGQDQTTVISLSFYIG